MENNSVKDNIVLIGMPGTGKSTVGILLAKALGKDFVDSDILIQVREGKTLQQIMDENDYLHLRDIEESVLTSIDGHHLVIATGGSAVYSEAAMNHLRHHGIIIYLDTPLPELRQRITDYDTRGIARRPNQSFEELYAERTALYRRYADITVSTGNASAEEVLNSTRQSLTDRSGP
ncbi:shikimate kinase [Porticoccus litoralis]|uniref:Shikimate kinase n=1 Tax=Porticoccus litoralis TaxID=434086 RepID=A0AAW8B4E2_9GAMM|nr:shikimate kinase [Porticoccus litoralis]MDP1521436.1 shikimate kinase [Porticoccus litoralis]